MVGVKQLVFLLATAFLFYACAKERSENQNSIERGKYLVTFGGCHDCHTPKVPGPGGAPALDTSKLLAGHLKDSPFPSWSPEDLAKRNVMATTNDSATAWAGPWGISFAINLTPDKSGIGEWSEEMFIRMARTGKHQGQPNGRDILPPMPWFNMKVLTDADLKAMWAYLRSLPPVPNETPLPISPPQAPSPPNSK